MEFNNIKDIIFYIEKCGIELSVQGGKIKYKAPEAVMNKEIISLLKNNKGAIIEELEKNKNLGELVIDRRGRYETFNMTDVQVAYALGRKSSFEYGNIACHIYMEFIYDNLDGEKVQDTWREIINHHDMLRAVVYENGLQQVKEDLEDFVVDIYNGKENSEEIIKEVRNKMSHKVYELGKWPMFNIAVTQCKDKSMMHFSIEFLIADWTSIWILLTEFEEIYFDKYKYNDEMKITFRDYILTENRLKESNNKHQLDKEFWLEKLDTIPMAPQLPVVKEAKVHKPVFKRKHLNLDIKLWEQLKDKAKKIGVTPTAMVLSAYAEAISLFSNKSKFSLNLTVLDRLNIHKDISKVVGDFTKIMLLKVDNNITDSFKERIKIINSNLFEVLDHSMYSGIELMREMAKNIGEKNILMPIVFTSAIGLIDKESKIRGKIEFQGISQTPQVFLDCQAMDNAEGLQVNWDYRLGVFREGVIDDMFNIFKYIMMELAQNEDILKKNIVVSLPEYQEKQRNSVNFSQDDLDKGLLYSKFIENTNIYKDKVAIVDSSGEFTYAQLHKLAIKIAKKIVESGGEKGDSIGIIMNKSRYQIASVLGVLYMGGVYIPIDGKYAIERRNQIIDEANINIALTLEQEELELGENVINLKVDKIKIREEDLFEIADIDISDPAYIIFTSGTTGKPKGVQISHEAAVNTIEDINRRYNVNSEDTVLGMSQLNFDLSVYDIFGLLSVGGTIVYSDSENYMNPRRWIELIENYNITIWNTVPQLMQILLTEVKTITDIKKGSLRLALLSGDWIPVNMPEEIINYSNKCKVVSLGGATEASIWSIYHEYVNEDKNRISIPYGKPLSNQQIYILNENYEDCPNWVVGNIYIAGIGLADCYYEDTDLTNKKFINHPTKNIRMYCTGDIGRYMDNGEVEFLGREDEQVKIRGYRVELGEIESCLNRFSSINEAFVLLNNENNSSNIYAVASLQKEAKKESSLLEVTDNIDFVVKDIKDKIKNLNYKKQKQAQDKVAYYTMLYAINKLGITSKIKKFTLEEIDNNKEINSKYRWIVKKWIVQLYNNKYLDRDSDGKYVCNIEVTKEEIEDLWKEVYACWDDAYGDRKILDYFKENADKIIGIINGKVDPIGILYPDGSNDYTEALYVKNTAAVIMSKYITGIVSRIVDSKRGRKVRILEIGAGTGATTKNVLKEIEGENYEYYFTDISKYFFNEAERNFKDNGKVKIRQLDINKEITKQGFEENYFDIVIAAYVFNNVIHMDGTIKNIQKLLSPKGYLLFSEPKESKPVLLISQAFLMTEPKDKYRKDKIFATVDMWSDVINNISGSHEIKILPEKESNLFHFDSVLYVKQFKNEYKQLDREELNSYIKDYLPDYMKPRNIYFLDSLPITDNGKLDKKAINKYINIKSKKEEFSEELTEYESQVLEIINSILKGNNMGRKSNFYDYGADSLIMAQITTKLRNELKLEIPFDVLLRDMLNNPTVEGIVNFINSYNEEEILDVASKKYESIAYVHEYGGEETDTLR